jgi:hypothetical protein
LGPAQVLSTRLSSEMSLFGKDVQGLSLLDLRALHVPSRVQNAPTRARLVSCLSQRALAVNSG